MLCIVCMTMKQRRTSGCEHVVPYALGGSFTIDRVCLDCDNRFGNTADAGLVNLTTIERRRAELELAGQSGVVPDPVKRTLKRKLVGMHDAKHRLVLQEGSRPGEVVAKTMPYVEFAVQHFLEGTLIQSARVYIDPSDADKAELAKSALRKVGINDEKVVERIAREFAASLEPAEYLHEFKLSVPVRVGGHQQGLLKIAYELAWYWLGDTWLDDPTAVAMRDSLNGRTPKTQMFGTILDDPKAGVIAVAGDPRVVHFAYVSSFDNRLVLFVHIFDLVTAGFVVASDATKYELPAKNAIVMQNVQRQYEETTFGPLAPGAVVWKHDAARSRFK
jgi:hypothetical protein